MVTNRQRAVILSNSGFRSRFFEKEESKLLVIEDQESKDQESIKIYKKIRAVVIKEEKDASKKVSAEAKWEAKH